MSRYYRSSSRRGKGSRKRASSGRRFQRPSIAVLNPRKLLSRKPRRAKVVKRKTRRKINLRSMIANRTWNATHVFAVLVLVTAIAAIAYGFASIDFYVYSADIADTQYTPKAAVYQQAGIDGYSIFFIDPDAIRQRLAELDHVHDAKVQIRLPARVSIELIERQPAILYQMQGNSWWIDDEGVIMPAVAKREGLIKLIDEDTGAAIDERHIDPAVLQAIQTISKDLPQVTTFRYQEPYGLFFISPEGWRVYLGTAENMDEKLANWEASRQNIFERKMSVQVVDLRYGYIIWR